MVRRRARGWESPSRSLESVAIALIHTVIGSLRYTPARSYFSGDTTVASRPSQQPEYTKHERVECEVFSLPLPPHFFFYFSLLPWVCVLCFRGNLKPRVLFKAFKQALWEISQVKPVCWEWVIWAKGSFPRTTTVTNRRFVHVCVWCLRERQQESERKTIFPSSHSKNWSDLKPNKADRPWCSSLILGFFIVLYSIRELMKRWKHF